MSRAKEVLSKFKEIEVGYDLSLLSDDIRDALPHLVAAMDVVSEIYRRQEDERLPGIWKKVMASGDEEKKRFYRRFQGPWDQLSDYATVYPEDLPDRAKGCAFYPEGMDASALEKAFAQASPDEQEKLRDTYTVVRKQNGTLVAIPYHEYYRADLERLADYIKKAAALIKHTGLKHYLLNRANGLLTGNYRDTEAEWVRLTDAPLEVVFGPFEVYADGLLGLKAMFEGFLLAVDHEKGAQLKEIEKNLDKLAALFPMPAGAQPAVGGMAPMVVAHELYAAGEAYHGIMTSAFNLPNDPWVRGNVGWKQVMIYNIMQAKFRTCTAVIAKRISDGRIAAEFDPYFYFVLMHEVSHGLGPAYRADGTKAAQAIGAAYTTVEEAKADIGGLVLLLKAGGTYGIPRFGTRQMLDSFFAGLFRSMRFGVHEAHGGANVIEFNWMKTHGVIEVKADGSFVTHDANFAKAAGDLLEELCRIEAAATPDEAAAFVKKWAHPGKEILDALEKLKDIPIDITPIYTR